MPGDQGECVENREARVKQARLKLGQVLRSIVEDPSISDNKKIAVIIHISALTCAIIAVQPIPFADIFILTPIQVVMVSALNMIIGNPIGKKINSKEIIAYLLGVLGWGLLAQQVILGLYKSFLPFMGGVTTVPLVYAATVGLGYAAVALLEARHQDQEISKEELKRIKNDYEEKAHEDSRKRDWSFRALKTEMEGWKEKAEELERFKTEIAQLRGEKLKIEKEVARCIKSSSSEYSDWEVEELLTDLDDRDGKISQLTKENTNLHEQLKIPMKSFNENSLKTEVCLRKRFQVCYPSMHYSNQVLKRIGMLDERQLYSLERQFQFAENDRSKLAIRCEIKGTNVIEVGFSNACRAYMKLQGSIIEVVRVGKKNTQKMDLRWIKANYGE